MRYLMQISFKAVFLTLFLGSVSCGVKGPPLPPIAVAPQQSESNRINSDSSPRPKASPKGSPSAKDDS
jgi:predicted small lipoprotein YifL